MRLIAVFFGLLSGCSFFVGLFGFGRVLVSRWGVNMFGMDLGAEAACIVSFLVSGAVLGFSVALVCEVQLAVKRALCAGS